LDLNLEMIAVSDLIGRVTGSMQLQAAQKHLQLTTELPPDTVPLIEADPNLLQQALSNLLDNAIKYTESGEKVTVRVYARENNIIFEVKDTGIGIAPVDQSRLFEKFFRGAQREAMKYQGTGLGLAIVKSIAERHHGRVWVESQLGKGSTFSLEIPLRQPRKEKKP
jgi:signal transduction histidine kinase